MSFNDKDGLEIIQDRKLPLDKDIFKGVVELPESRAELIMMPDNLSAIDAQSKQDDNITSIKLPTRESVKDNTKVNTIESDRTPVNKKEIESPEKTNRKPQESTVGLFEKLDQVLNTSFDEKQKQQNPPKSSARSDLQKPAQESHRSSSHEPKKVIEKARSSSIEAKVPPRCSRAAKRSMAELRGQASSQERKKNDAQIPSLLLLSKRPSMVNSNTGTTLNSLRDAELNKSSSRNRTLSQNRFSRGGYTSETPSSIPGSLNYLEQDRSSQAVLRFSDYASINSRISLGGESQNDVDSLVKHMKGGNEGRSESELGDYLEGSLSRFEYKLASNREHKSRDHGLGPIQENGFLSRKRVSKQINETEMEDDILDSAVKGGSDWLSYEVRLKKKRAPGDRSSLPTGINHNRSRSNARATSIEQQVREFF